MRMKRLYHYILPLCRAVLLLLAAVPTGCIDDRLPADDCTDTPQGRPVTAVLNVSVSISNSAQAGTRTTRRDGDYNLNGTEAENRINSLTLFLVDLNEDGAEDASTVRHQTRYLPAVLSDDNETCQFTMDTSTGKKHVYVGANLSERQIAAFEGSKAANGTLNNVYAAQEHSVSGDQYDELMAEFAKPNNFTMFGSATDQEGTSKEIEITGGDDGVVDEPIRLKVGLQRLVAKVLIVANSDERSDGESGKEYVRMIDKDGNTDAPCWARLEDVRFMLNVVNRKIYLNQVMTEGGVVTDPNHKFEDLIEPEFGVFKFKEEKVRDFLNWVPQVWDYTGGWGTKAEKYDKTKLDKNNVSNHYTAGRYCLENTIEGTFPSEWNQSAADPAATLMVTTYALVAVKMTPKVIYTGDAQPYNATSEDGAKSKLPAVDAESYPAGTFYMHDGKVYSYDGMIAAIGSEANQALPDDDLNKLFRESFVTYPGGWGYYYTYIDGKNEGGKLTFSEDSSVLRNYYYILHVEKFSFPPESGSGSVTTMQVNTQKYEWEDNNGSGETTLYPEFKQ